MIYFNDKSQKLINQIEQLGLVITEQKGEIGVLQQKLIDQDSANQQHIELIKKDFESQLKSKDELERLAKITDDDQINEFSTQIQSLQNRNGELREVADSLENDNRVKDA